MAAQEDETSATAEFIECPVCYQECVHPVKLPCSHIFCYLCVKGVVTRTKKCAMCRRAIPLSYLENPEMIDKSNLDMSQRNEAVDIQWFYQARRRGWWVYEERTAAELEQRYQNNQEDVFDIQIAGFLYTIDFENMEQYRKDDRNVRRSIKRDHIKHVDEVQGKAGIRLNNSLSSISARTVEGSPNVPEVSTNIPSSTTAPTLPDMASDTNGPDNVSSRPSQGRRSDSRALNTRQAQPVDITQLVADMNLIDRAGDSSDDSNEPESLV